MAYGVFEAEKSVQKFMTGAWDQITIQDWQKLASEVQYKYAHTQSDVDKGKLRDVVLAFQALMTIRKSQKYDPYYVGNFPKSGEIEGTWEQVVGTVVIATERALQLIDARATIDSNLAEFMARNLPKALQEDFTDLGQIRVSLAPYLDSLLSVATGQL